MGARQRRTPFGFGRTALNGAAALRGRTVRAMVLFAHTALTGVRGTEGQEGVVVLELLVRVVDSRAQEGRGGTSGRQAAPQAQVRHGISGHVGGPHGLLRQLAATSIVIITGTLACLSLARQLWGTCCMAAAFEMKPGRVARTSKAGRPGCSSPA